MDSLDGKWTYFQIAEEYEFMGEIRIVDKYNELYEEKEKLKKELAQFRSQVK